MKSIAPLIISSVLASCSLLITNKAAAAFIIEASDSATPLGLGNFSYTGTGGTVASYSTASAGQLPATTDSTPTYFTLRHAFGGNGTADEYTFSYTPALHGDNYTFEAGTTFNSLGTSPDLTSTGLENGLAGTYNVYRIHPSTPNVAGGNTTYRVSVNSTLILTEIIDQNATNINTGQNVGRWELIGSVDLLNATDTVTVKMTPTSSPYVSMRASGIMFEYVAPIPEPEFAALLCLGAGMWMGCRRR